MHNMCYSCHNNTCDDFLRHFRVELASVFHAVLSSQLNDRMKLYKLHTLSTVMCTLHCQESLVFVRLILQGRHKRTELRAESTYKSV